MRHESDVCIVGGGISAAMLAQKLAELRPELRIVVVEAGARIFDVGNRMTYRQRMLEYGEKRVSLASSTLQDVRTGRELELDALVNAVIDIARLTKTPVPTLETVAACIGMLNRRIVEDRISLAPRPLEA